MQIDQQALRVRVGCQDNAVDQRANQFRCFIASRLVVQRIDESRHLRAVAKRHVRMKEDRRRLLTGHEFFQLLATDAERVELRLHVRVRVPILHRFDDPALLPGDLAQLGLIGM
ncbi:hypothetical protein LRS73_27760 [Methylobacterium currus]|uniref:hypothetical protein n=1 Tax=Methylobacterium currus TaxID=2051553 RepID=UPI001E59676F|nr:hypothetical protein [Methylobacterium currus]UHC16219.1 hypothetical protein LRS73_27760 [Methylobacterium currus]